MQQVVLVVIVLVAAVCAVACVRVLWREARAAPFAVMMLTLAMTVLTLYETRLIGRGSTIQFTLIALCAAVGVLSLLPGRSARPRLLKPDFLLPALVTFVLFFANAVANPTQSPSELFARLAPLLFWIVVAVVLSTSPISIPAVGAAMGLSLAVAAIASVLTEPWRQCDQFKCGVFGAIFRGPFPSENYLAQIASLAAIAAIAVGVGRLRILILALAAIILVAATSRTAMIALVASLLVGWLLARGRPPLRRTTVFAVTAMGAVASVFVVSTAAPETFSNRGWIWMRSVQAVDDDILLGVGIDRWAQLQAIGALPANNFPHNQLVLMFFAGGVAACAAYLLMLWRVSRQTVVHSATAAAGFALLTYLLVGGITEVTWNPATIDGHCVPILLLLALRAASMTPRSGDDDEEAVPMLVSDAQSFRRTRS